MKRNYLFFMLILLIFLTLSSCDLTSKRKTKLLTERIEYKAVIKSPDPDFNWWIQNIEGSKREVFIKQIMNAAIIGKVKVYDNNNNVISPVVLKNSLGIVDTVTLKRAKEPFDFFDTIIVTKFDFDDVGIIQFREQWLVGEDEFFIEKKINGFGLCSEKFSSGKPVFWIYPDSNHTISDDKRSKILTGRIQYDVPIVTIEPNQKWWDQNIESSKREPFLNSLMEAAFSGKYKLYDYFNNIITKEEVLAMNRRVYTLAIQKAVEPYEWYDTVVVSEFDPKDIKKIRFLEEWYLDEPGFGFRKNILGISPIVASFDETGSFRGYKPLFWIYFDERYPIKE